jgi:small GTP-binding protein
MIQKKICMAGSPSVGKTSLVARYVHSIFSEKYLSTVGVKIDKKVVRVNGRELTLLLWDLAGDDEFQPLKASFLRGAAGYLLVADGSRRRTLDRAVELQERIAAIAGAIPFVLVLNKCDLVKEWEIDQACINTLIGRGWIVRRTSAKEGAFVEEVFAELSRMLLNGPASEPSETNRTMI